MLVSMSTVMRYFLINRRGTRNALSQVVVQEQFMIGREFKQRHREKDIARRSEYRIENTVVMGILFISRRLPPTVC